ncbi:hypothetical protein [Chryseolinea lacunae]|uniref:Uncharacterized protein n=1 Tax=Chryseolinea lacunae TaxID=2801331 RepID=A0ABS1KKC1_9BACT|nr:hypothetical protein [Chryseolinea lacunae]MBL0739904.1 hypothetical protein [Chryseolinea lacunae]
MKTFNVLILLLLSACLAPAAYAQVGATALNKGFSVKTASTMVNKDAAYQPVATEKSSIAISGANYELVKGYDRQLHVSYQIASLTAVEWVNVRMRAADMLDAHNWIFLAAKGVLDPLEKLAWDEFVPLSVYAPMNIKLSFNYNSRKFSYYVNPLDFAPINNTPAIHTKTLLIKK